jgi:hypothetical protein
MRCGKLFGLKNVHIAQVNTQPSLPLWFLSVLCTSVLDNGGLTGLDVIHFGGLLIAASECADLLWW